MWAQLLPLFVGGTLTDADLPNHPTTIVGFSLTASHVYIEGQDFRFGGDRRYFGINAGPDDRTFYVNGPMLSALVRLPDGVAPLS